MTYRERMNNLAERLQRNRAMQAIGHFFTGATESGEIDAMTPGEIKGKVQEFAAKPGNSLMRLSSGTGLFPVTEPKRELSESVTVPNLDLSAQSGRFGNPQLFGLRRSESLRLQEAVNTTLKLK